jgi:hypothetical protein
MDSGKLPEATWWPQSAAGKTYLYLERLLASMLEINSSNRPNAQQVLESLTIIRAGEFAQSEVLLTGDDTVRIQAFPVYSSPSKIQRFLSKNKLRSPIYRETSSMNVPTRLPFSRSLSNETRNPGPVAMNFSWQLAGYTREQRDNIIKSLYTSAVCNS